MQTSYCRTPSANNDSPIGCNSCTARHIRAASDDLAAVAACTDIILPMLASARTGEAASTRGRRPLPPLPTTRMVHSPCCHPDYWNTNCCHRAPLTTRERVLHDQARWTEGREPESGTPLSHSHPVRSIQSALARWQHLGRWETPHTLSCSPRGIAALKRAEGQAEPSSRWTDDRAPTQAINRRQALIRLLGTCATFE